jgi:DNA-dependent RNA polymerase auxiliary subunit epsilon
VRKRIVATKEGGAITGEERLREHTDQLYGAIIGYEGAPGAYHIERIDVLEAELADIEKEFETLATTELPGVNKSLQSIGRPVIAMPPKVPAMADAGVGSSSSQWLATRKRKDKKSMFHSLPQDAVELR